MRMLRLILAAIVLAAGWCEPARAAQRPQAPPVSLSGLVQRAAVEPAPALAVSRAGQAPQAQPAGPTVCEQTVPLPSRLPPAGSEPIVWLLAPCFPKQGNVSVIDPQTYAYYIQTPRSRPSENVWVSYDQTIERALLDDFKRLWATQFLDDLAVEVQEYTFPNGVTGKVVLYNMEERQRVKIVDYMGSKNIEMTKVDEKLKETNSVIRLDSFLNQSAIQKVKGVVKEMLAEKGYQFAKVTPETKELPGGPKLVHLTFQIEDGPRVKIRNVDFDGNKALGDFALRRQLKTNKPKGLLGWITGGGIYQEAKYAEDADKLVEYYRNRGYIGARIGDPELKQLEDSSDRRTRWVQLRIPINEGDRYRVGDFSFDGNTVVKGEYLRGLFKVKPGRFYSDKVIRKGLEKAREAYGTVGYFEFTAYPDLRPRDLPEFQQAEPPAEGAEPPAEGFDAAPKPAGESTQKPAGEAPPKPASGSEPAKAAAGPAQTAEKPPEGAAATQKPGSAAAPAAKPAAPRLTKGIVDVVMKVQEGKQYFVNRITFTGNTNTRDNVVRREVRLYEGGVFNTEALKYSIKRLNQLAYFKPLEGGKDVNVDKTPGADSKVDVTLKFEEQNRNQITFGAGVSQWEGYFGQLSFQTSNFMGRGETFSVLMQAGSRAQNYQIAFTEPFLFDRNITGGIDIYKRQYNFISQFSQSSTGGNVIFGYPLKDFSRLFVNYSYERVRVTDINQYYLNPLLLAQNPYLRDSLLIGESGVRTVSKIVPSFVHNSVDNPIFPTAGKRFTASIDLAVLGGNTKFYKPSLEAVWYIPQTKRLSIGMRAQVEYITPTGSTKELPIFEKLFLGGEYSVRGFDLRTIGPKAAPVTTPATYNGLGFFPGFVPGEASVDPLTVDSGLVVGGNKSLLLNAEYLISIAGPVRLVLFYDAGQALDRGQRFAIDQFKTSTGAEIRFFMPVLNVPFRLIAAYNPRRLGVLDNNLQQAKRFTFRFAVGSTF